MRRPYVFIHRGEGPPPRTCLERRTLPVGLYSFVGGEFAQWGEMMAATAMTMGPTLVLFMLMQKRLAGGLTAGAVRG